MSDKTFKKVIPFGGHKLTLETGAIARQATGAVMVRVNDAAVLVTAVAKKEAREGASFFPLTVNYQERMYAAGKIPGGFLKREGRPGDHETLTSRLIDRPLRPLFPKNFRNDVQVVATVMSYDPSVQPDILAMIGASAALSLSGAPFSGPIAGARVGFKDGQYLLNPSSEQLAESDLDLVVAGTEDAVLMVESDANELPEDVMLGAVLYGHEQMQIVIQAINEMVKACGKEKWVWQAPEENKELAAKVKADAFDEIKKAYAIHEKEQRQEALHEIKTKLIDTLVDEDNGISAAHISSAQAALEKEYVRSNILAGELRIDGRDTRSIRPIRVETGLLPRTHGSSLFTRGETQAIVAVALGTEREAQRLDSIHGSKQDRFMLHYNFPPYCVGETGMMASPKRREIGHGNLAKRALKAMLPTEEAFPYVLRVVSEVTESNGSSSMATVCGSTLSLMDAGVPIKAPVAGIAMGLIKEGNQFAVLSDILGDEDHLGDMDFKVAGTANGITALQMDIKITGINREIMEAALSQAKDGREHILGIMNQVIDKPKAEVSSFAPRIFIVQVKPEKVREVIGKGGATIRGIIEDTGVEMDINDEGIVKIYAVDEDAALAAKKRVEDVVAEAEIGKIYEGKVARLADFGAFVTILPGKDGLVHISQIADKRVEKVSDHLSEGQVINVKVLDVDRQGRIKLTMKDLIDKPSEAPKDEEKVESKSE